MNYQERCTQQSCYITLLTVTHLHYSLLLNILFHQNLVNKNVFTAFLNDTVDVISPMYLGTSFHNFGPATLKALSAKMFLFVKGISRIVVSTDDLSALELALNFSLSFKYWGASPIKQLCTINGSVAIEVPWGILLSYHTFPFGELNWPLSSGSFVVFCMYVYVCVFISVHVLQCKTLKQYNFWLIFPAFQRTNHSHSPDGQWLILG